MLAAMTTCGKSTCSSLQRVACHGYGYFGETSSTDGASGWHGDIASGGYGGCTKDGVLEVMKQYYNPF